MTYKVEIEIEKGGQVTINNLPFKKGERVEVVIEEVKMIANQKYPLRGKVTKYESPFEAATDSKDWEVSQ